MEKVKSDRFEELNDKLSMLDHYEKNTKALLKNVEEINESWKEEVEKEIATRLDEWWENKVYDVVKMAISDRLKRTEKDLFELEKKKGKELLPVQQVFETLEENYNQYEKKIKDLQNGEKRVREFHSETNDLMKKIEALDKENIKKIEDKVNVIEKKKDLVIQEIDRQSERIDQSIVSIDKLNQKLKDVGDLDLKRKKVESLIEREAEIEERLEKIVNEAQQKEEFLNERYETLCEKVENKIKKLEKNIEYTDRLKEKGKKEYSELKKRIEDGLKEQKNNEERLKTDKKWAARLLILNVLILFGNISVVLFLLM